MSDDQANEHASDIRAAIMEALANDLPVDDAGNPIQAFVTKAVILVEWMDASGARWLTRRTMMGDGTPGPVWDAAGMLFEALHGTWSGDS